MTLSRTVAKQFITDYLRLLTDEATTPTGPVTSFFASMGNKIFNYKEANTNRKECDEIIKDINKLQTAEHVIELILKLGKKAHAIQLNTVRSISDCAETLHAVRNYLLRYPQFKLEACGDSIDIGGLDTAIENRIKIIKNEILAKASQTAENVKKNEDVNPDEIYYEYYRQLIYLGYDEYIYKIPVTKKQMKECIFPESGMIKKMYDWQPYSDNEFKHNYNKNFPRIAQKQFAEMLACKNRQNLEGDIIQEYQKEALLEKTSPPKNDIQKLEPIQSTLSQQDPAKETKSFSP